ncbi:hypothetical protein L2K70_10890 [Nocardioides KLBMP 9356]|uniref:Uncharacterized protein n=1 Tax=Nocardioides potassii TaxID=2911371 RepID=A0ABS9HDB4_9ACTN|nr:hypothetical protein [Nocardioides potassii]MCF6378108.1 hypothetical protein [Nocardioides potassii]
MSDELREELVTLGQRIALAELERADAVARVADLWRRHREVLPIEEVATWSTLSHRELAALGEGR